MPEQHRHLANKCEDFVNLLGAEAHCVTHTACLLEATLEYTVVSDTRFVGGDECYSARLGVFYPTFVLQLQFCGIRGLCGGVSTTECLSSLTFVRVAC